MAPAVALGTAQFGLDYGISNHEGKVGSETVTSILDLAHRHGVAWLDTAAAYGDAEQVLATQPLSHSFRLCTKIGASGATTADELEEELTQSLARLKRSSLDVLLLHRPDALMGPQAKSVLAWAMHARRMGRIGGFGVSLYSPDEIVYALLPGIDWVQIPMSILAQDWLSSGALDRLRAQGVRIQIRSLLAQGLLAADPAKLPAPLAGLVPALERVHAAAAALGCSSIDLALAFAARQRVDLLVLGVQSSTQLDDCIAALERGIELEWANFEADSKALDPRFWPAGLKIEG